MKEAAAINFSHFGERPRSAPQRPIDPFPSSGRARLARTLIKARLRRKDHFKASLFSDPAWDILLDLFVAQCEGRRIPISAAGLTAGIPLTTALRWLAALESEGLIEREDDPLDGRRTYVSLTERGTRSMWDYFHFLQALLGAN